VKFGFKIFLIEKMKLVNNNNESNNPESKLKLIIFLLMIPVRILRAINFYLGVKFYVR